jgi:hypothetical protein
MRFIRLKAAAHTAALRSILKSEGSPVRGAGILSPPQQPALIFQV